MKDWFRLDPVASSLCLRAFAFQRFVCVVARGNLAGFDEREANVGFSERCRGPNSKFRDACASSHVLVMPNLLPCLCPRPSRPSKRATAAPSCRLSVPQYCEGLCRSCYHVNYKTGELNTDVPRLSVSAVGGPHFDFQFMPGFFSNKLASQGHDDRTSRSVICFSSIRVVRHGFSFLMRTLCCNSRCSRM